MSLVSVSRKLSARVAALKFGPPVTHVYNPLEYAQQAHERYLERFGTPPKEAVFVGMNPGPFGMAQTGVPFGDVRMVRDWMGISFPIQGPAKQHAKRPVFGFDCARSEVSGTRLWGWARERFGTADAFFRRFFVLNYCPLCFMESSGKNCTPDSLSRAEREPLFEACDQALRESIEILKPRLVVGVGQFAAKRAEIALAGMNVRVGCILHPSPQSPKANSGWAKVIEEELRDLGVQMPPPSLV